MPTTRLFFTTDIHGSEKCFRKFISAAKFYGANVLILGGDITGKMVVPIIDRGNGKYSYNFSGKELTLKSKDGLNRALVNIRDAGSYPYLSNEKEIAELQADRSKVDSLFEKLMVDSIDRWVSLAQEKLAGTGVTVHISPGNDDTLAIDEHLVNTGVVFNPERQVVKIDGVHEMLTLGYTNHTPWNSRREVDEIDLERMLEEMCSKVDQMSSCIFNVHVPPIQTIIDRAPALDTGFKPIVEGGHLGYVSAGSSAVRKMIEKYQPLVGVHGHIHESKGVVKIGRTHCFNPGSEYAEGILRGLLLDLEDDRIKSHLFTQG